MKGVEEVEANDGAPKPSGVAPSTLARLTRRTAEEALSEAFEDAEQAGERILPREAGVRPSASAKLCCRMLSQWTDLVEECQEQAEPGIICASGVCPGDGLVKWGSAPLSYALSLGGVQELYAKGMAEEDAKILSYYRGQWAPVAVLEDEMHEASETEAEKSAKVNQLKGGITNADLLRPKRPKYQSDLQFIRELAVSEPKIVANAIREWLDPTK